MTGICTLLGKKIDLLGMDACLMNMVEVAYQLRDSVSYIVGSEIEEPFDGWPYTEILTYLTAKPTRDAATFAKEIVRRYVNSYQGKNETVTQSALDVSRIAEMTAKVDAPVEQVMYLDRFMEGHELLQAIARVNRCRNGKTHGLVVDYYGVGDRLTEALAMYAREDVKGALVSIKDELPKLDDRHRRVLDLFHRNEIADITDVDACVNLLRDVDVRADFIDKFGDFAESMDIILPRPEVLPYIYDLKLLGFINKTAANRYRDSQLNIAGVGDKVKRLIDEHIVAQGVDPKVPPISILDEDFEKEVNTLKSKKSQALEMEHAAKFYIQKHFNEDPALYKKLSERLKNILDNFGENWDALAEELRKFIKQTREGRKEDETGLDPKTQAPFLGILLDEYGKKPSDDKIKEFCEAVIDVVDHIKQEIMLQDFWRRKHAQNVLRTWLINEIDDRNLVPYAKIHRLADRFLELAKTLHVRLVKS